MDDNIQQQADEIAVLQSIYGDDTNVKDESNIEINVNVPIKEGFSVISPPPPRQTTTSTLSTSPSSSPPPPSRPAELGEALPLIALPPIHLTITYHPEYPSNEPPLFILSCCWLSGLQLTELCKQLDQIWNEAKGEVVVFRWVSWLAEEAISFLGIQSPYVLPIYDNTPDMAGHNDMRAYSSCDPYTIGLLLDFDKYARRDVFLKTEQTCGICYMEYPGINCVHQVTCEHPYCKDCMRQMCQVHIQAGTIAELKCPEKSCRQPILPHIVRELVSEEMYARYDRLSLDRSLSSMEDIMWCPHCSFAVIIDTKDSLGACTNCNFSFCTTCMQNWHPARECSSSNGVLDALKQRVSSAKKQVAEKLKAEMDSITWMAGHTKMCPKCKIPIEKTEGCNKMTCSKCGSYFCWNCNRQISGYSHFGGNCKLFPDNPLYNPDGVVANPNFIARPEAAVRRDIQRQMHIINMQNALQRNPELVKKCPRCRNQVARLNNNNHIACWSCGSQFCFLCLEFIFGTAHFHKGKCKHHTVE